MPIPQPRDTESQDEFISRCMSDEKIKELGISKHYDNNENVVNQLGIIGVLFK